MAKAQKPISKRKAPTKKRGPTKKPIDWTTIIGKAIDAVSRIAVAAIWTWR